MAALHASENTNNASLAGDREAPPPTAAAHRLQGGRTTTPFIIGTVFGLTLAGGGFFGNLIVLLIQKFHIKSINAAQFTNVVNGCINFFPLIGAIVADSFFGCFSVIWISSLVSLLGTVLLLVTLKIDGLSPEKCRLQGTNLLCATPSRIQYGALYSSVALVSIGTGGTRFTLATMGANQFSKLKHQSSYFNWYFFSLYSASLISSTAIVYIEDNLGWGWGLGICIAANLFGLALFLMGSRHYIRDNPRTSPFTGLLRVVVASVRKRKMDISSQTSDYYHDDDYDDDGVKRISPQPPTNWFRLVNRAALKKEGEIEADGSISKPWKLCSVEQVEDLKSIIRVLPLWSSSIFLSTPIGVQLSLTIVQALTTNRHVIHHVQFPPSSIVVFSLIATALTIILIHHCLLPLCKKLISAHPPTPLQLIGIGHVFNVASMAVSALVESHRRSAAGQISVAWLVPQMVVVGIGEAFHFPGQVGLYYQEFPRCLKTLATAMVAMLIGVAFYLSTAVVDLMRRVTDWLPDNINNGRVDNVYWVMVGIGIINFGYFLAISHFYTYNNHVDHSTDE